MSTSLQPTDVADWVSGVFRETCHRYGVRYLTALMTMAALEALVPGAPDQTKAAVVRQLDAMKGCVGESEFLALVRLAKASTWVSDSDLTAACESEIQRQRNIPSKQTVVDIFPSSNLADDLREEIAVRDRCIAEQRERIDQLSGQLAQNQAPARVEYALLEDRCRRLEQELALAKMRMQQQPAQQLTSSRPTRSPGVAAVSRFADSSGAAGYGVYSPVPPRLSLLTDTLSPMSALITQTNVQQAFVGGTPAIGGYAAATPPARSGVPSPGPPQPMMTPMRHPAATWSSGSRGSALHHIVDLGKRETLDSLIYSPFRR